MQDAQLQADQASIGHFNAERELIAQAAQGNENAFESIMRQHNRRLFRTARSILGNDADAEEALQEAYLSAWKALAGFRSDSKLSTWLVRVVANEALGRLRRAKTNILPLDTIMSSPDPDVLAALTERRDREPEQLAIRTQLRNVLETHIDLLPDMYRTVFVLRAIEEMSTEEVAIVLQMPEATVRTRYSRARILLRASLTHDIDITFADTYSFDGERCDRIVNAVLQRGRDLQFHTK